MNLSNLVNNSVSSKTEIESLFNKILSPIKKELDPNLVGQFCSKLNNDLDGAQIAIDLITIKIQSTQEWEALIALYVLEACVKNCGERFHDLIGRFRFLNEMIKLVSPKYLGNRTSDKVKKRCIELLYAWSQDLTQKTKIKEAYDMLKRQGIVQSDPVNVDRMVINVTPRAKNPIFDDDEKSKQLSRLLKSKNPQDLEMANKLIKNMVKQDEIKTEKISNRINELEHINNNVKILNDMLLNYNSSNASESEKETIKFLYEELEKLRPNLVQLATETEENDDAIGDILKTNDQCEKILSQFKLMFFGQLSNGNHASQLDDVKLVNLGSIVTVEEHTQPKSNYDPLKELEDLFSTPVSSTVTQNNYDDFLNFNDSSSVTNNIQTLLSSINVQTTNQQPLMPPLIPPVSQNQFNNFNKSTSQQLVQNLPVKTPQLKALEDLNQLGKNLMEKSLNDPKTPINAALTQSNVQIESQLDLKNLSLKDLQTKMMKSSAGQNNDQTNVESFAVLNNLFVTLESIKPNTALGPFELYEKNGLKVVIHFARDAPNTQNIHVCVISVTSSNTDCGLRNFVFQAAVPKSMKIKLQPASRSDLPVYNPIFPPTAITQVMLIANPNKEQIRLKYKLSYSFDDLQFNEMDDVKTLPNLS